MCKGGWIKSKIDVVLTLVKYASFVLTTCTYRLLAIVIAEAVYFIRKFLIPIPLYKLFYSTIVSINSCSKYIFAFLHFADTYNRKFSFGGDSLKNI